MAAPVSGSHAALCFSSHEGHSCDEGESGLAVSSNSPPQPRSFIHRLEITAPFYLPGTWLSPSALNMFCGIACTLSFSFFLSSEISTGELLTPFSLIRKAQRITWRNGRRKWVRGFFSTSPMLKCPLLLVVKMVRGGGRQEAEAMAYLAL